MPWASGILFGMARVSSGRTLAGPGTSEPNDVPVPAERVTGRSPSARAERPVDGPAAEAWRLLFELFRAEKPRFQAVSSELGLSHIQAHALHLLEPGRPVPMSAVAEGLACDASNVTGIVDRLEERGLIERRGAAHDRRVRMLYVTDEGARLRRAVAERMFSPPPAITRLSPADQRALRDVLRRALER